MAAVPVYVVAGAAGFIGARTTEFLLASGAEIVGIDDVNDAYDVRLKQWRLERLLRNPLFRFVRADISDGPSLAEALTGLREVDAVLNLAARAGVRQSVRDPLLYEATNVRGTLNLLEYCRRSGISKFLLASSSSLYGAHNPMPFNEDADTDHPLSPYAASKKGAEVMAYTYHHLHAIDISVLRYFTVYGPAGRPDMSPLRFVQWVAEGRPVVVYGDGTQSRDFTYVDDIAKGTVAALKPVGYEVINLGSDAPVALGDILAEIEHLLQTPADREFRSIHAADVAKTWADITKARRVLGWEPTVDWRDGLARLVEWYVANREWASRIDTGSA